MQWVLVTEYIACVNLFVLAAASLGGNYGEDTPSGQLFLYSLITAFLTILFDFASVYMIMHPADFTRDAIIWSNTGYFLLLLLMITTLASNANALLFEDRPEAPRYKRIYKVIWILFAIEVVLTLTNFRTGWLFTVDESKAYARGAAVWAPYGLMALDIGVLFYGYVRERKQVRPAFKQVAFLLPPLLVLAAVLQSRYPNIPLSGTLAATALTVLFIYGQQQKLYTDHLTNLVSREMFYKMLEKQVDRGQPFRVIVIKLQEYKAVNNRLGQRTGDKFLRQVGQWLEGLESNCVTCRFTGVEFALILRGYDEGDSTKLIATIRERFSQPWEVGEHSAKLRSHVVDIAFPEHAASVNELVSSLEYAVRIAKKRGSSGVVRFDKQLRNQVGRRGYVIDQVERAVEEDRYFLEYQPIYDCAKKKIVGAEALCRLAGESGTISPGEFIPLAEEMKLGSKIDEIVTGKVCSFLGQNPDMDLEWISVNISDMQHCVAQEQAWLHELLARYGVKNSKIKLEISERTMISEPENALIGLEQLRASGIAISMDDFGIGYSNLFSLTHLPLDCVKIDKSLLDHIVQDIRARELLHTIVKGIQALDKRVLVEGVETKEQMRIVEDLGVDMIQGFYLGRPMSDMALLARLSTEQVVPNEKFQIDLVPC